MLIARKIAYNVLISSISKFISTALALVSIAFITRYLGKEGFGNYATILAFLGFFTAIADLGLYPISTREISRENADEEKIIGNIFSLRILSALAVFILSPIVASFFPYPYEVKLGIVIIAASFVFSSGYSVLNGIFQKRLIMDRIAIIELVGKIVQVITVVAAVRFRLGFSWVVLSLFFNMAVNFALVLYLARKHVKLKFKFNFDYWKIFLKESMPMGIVSIITFLYFKMDTIILSVMKSSGDVGIYNAAYKVLENLTFFPSMIMGLVFPIISKNIFTNREDFINMANKVFKIFIILSIPLIIATLFLSEGIINLIGGGGFAESANVLRILVFALAFIFFGNFFNNILIAGNIQKKLVLVLAVAAAVNIALNIIFIPHFSFYAAAVISAGTEFLVVVFGFYLAYSKLNYLPRAEKVLPILAASFIMAIFFFIFANKVGFFISAISGTLIYFIALWLFRAVKTSEITSIISKKGVREYEEIP